MFWENELRITVEAKQSSISLMSPSSYAEELTNHIEKTMTPSITSIVKVTTHPLLSKTYPKALGYDSLRTHPIPKYFRKQQNHTTTPLNRTDSYRKVLMYSKNENVQDGREKTNRKSAQENMSPPKNVQDDKI